MRAALFWKPSTLSVRGHNSGHTAALAVSCDAAVLLCVCHSHGLQLYFADNDKFLIGVLIFLTVVVSLALLFVVYKIYILKRGSPRWVRLKGRRRSCFCYNCEIICFCSI